MVSASSSVRLMGKSLVLQLRKQSVDLMVALEEKLSQFILRGP